MWGGEFIALLQIAALTMVLAVIGYPILVAPVRGDPRRCVRCWFVYWLGLVGWFVGWTSWVFISSGRHLTPHGWGLMGLLGGMVAGSVVGRIAWIVLKSVNEEIVP